MYFWRNSLIPKELQDHIEKTIKKLSAQHQNGGTPATAADAQYHMDEFLDKAQQIISGSIVEKEKNKKQ
jgi:hypothetical protein